MASREDTVTITGIVSAAYPWANLTTATIDIWAEILIDVDGPLAIAATKALLGEAGQYPPSVGMIRQRAFDLVTGSDDGWESGWQAWKQHLRDCRAPEYLCPHDRSEIFDPVTHHTVEAIGWQTLARMDQDQEATIRAQFRDIWKAAAQRQADKVRRHPAVQQVIEAARPQMLVAPTPRVQSSLDHTTPMDFPTPTITGVISDIDAGIKRDGRPRRAEFEEAVKRAAAQLRSGSL